MIMAGLVATNRIRTCPDFLIIGAQKAGTTSLYSYLITHRSVAPAIKKEIHFFDLPQNFSRGVRWYRAHFPTYLSVYLRRLRGEGAITGEATPYYIFHPLVPARVWRLSPQMKLIAVLRNPIDRAFSHYHHSVKYGYETLTFEEAIGREPERLAGEVKRIRADQGYHSINHMHFSYLTRGLYADQLEEWLKFFPRGQILVIKSEDLASDPDPVLREVTEFLELVPGRFVLRKRYNVGAYTEINLRTRERLLDYYNSPNQNLYRLLSKDFGWA